MDGNIDTPRSLSASPSDSSESFLSMSASSPAPSLSASSRDSAKPSSLFASSRDSAKPAYRAPIKHNKQRRKTGHDYTSPCIYLVTVTTLDRRPLLGTLAGNNPDEAHVIPSDLGNKVIDFFLNIEKTTFAKTGCRVQVLHFQLMPEHFHGILYVHDQLPANWPLGQIISGWKGACSRAYWSLFPSSLAPLPAPSLSISSPSSSLSASPSDSSEPSSLSAASRDSAKLPSLFTPGFNDRILNRKDQLQGWYDYLRDNPRRRWLKEHFPDRFRKIYDFKAGKQEHRYTAMGNTFHITYPERVQVRCHRNLSDAEIQQEVAHYLTVARGGAILVSPFISPAEKAVYDACYAERLNMIKIVNRGMDNKFVFPSGRDLQGCYEGFLLVMAPYADNTESTRDARISRAQCLNMNDFAADLSTIVC